MNFKIFTALVISFMMISISAYSQSKYLDSTRTTLSLIGGLGFSENSSNKFIGLNFSLKGSIDIGFQIGSVSVEQFQLNEGITFEGTGTSFSGQGYLFLSNQRRDNPVNFGITVGGSNSKFESFEVSNFGAGLFLSGNNMKESQKIKVTPSLEVIYILLNEVTEDGRTNAGTPLLSGSFSLGLSTVLSDLNILFLEPGLIYIEDSDNIGFGMSFGIIF